MPHNSPENVPIVTYLWVLALALWGGVANNIRKVRMGLIRFSLAELIGDIVISGFIGVVTYFICDYYHVHDMLAAAFVGISAHMGTRAITAAETAIGERLKIKIPEEQSQTSNKENQ